MREALDPLRWIALEEEIEKRAASSGLSLAPGTREALAKHARAVLAANERLHLTSITEPHEFLERHVGEAFEGAALLPADVAGTPLDVGSGNGYPALPVAAARPGLRPLLVEASAKKAAFLEEVMRAWSLTPGEVRRMQVQRAADLVGIEAVRVLTTRGVVGWTRLLPKLAPVLGPDGVILLWAGADVETVRHRVAWRRLRLDTSRPLPGRERAAIWMFRAERASVRG